jgi:hypothetical protein
VGIDQTLLSITRSQVSDFSSGTVASAGFATTSGTAVFATTSGTATYATTSGTAVNISGTVTQSQVTNLTSDLALKAPLASPTFSGTVTLPFASTGLLQSGTAGAIVKSDPAPGLGYIPYTASTSGNYAWLDLNLVARDNIVNAFTVGGHSITSEGTAIVPLVLKGASGQTGNLFEIQNNAGGLLLRMTNSDLRVANQIMTGNSGSGVLGQFTAYVQSASTIGAVIRGAASQSANLQEWQNSAGTVRSSVSSAGYVYGVGLYTNGSEMGFETGNGGGRMKFTRCTSLPSNQGANQAIIYFRDGTTAGTLKLVVRAGAAGAETTILDNIPQ